LENKCNNVFKDLFYKYAVFKFIQRILICNYNIFVLYYKKIYEEKDE